MAELIYKDLSYKIQGAFFEVYKSFGNAHKESIYHNALLEEMKKIGLKVESQKRITVHYKGNRVGVYTPDIIVENLVLTEVKSKPALIRSDLIQFWHYLKGSEYRLGYLVNFGSINRVEYIRRVYDTARVTKL